MDQKVVRLNRNPPNEDEAHRRVSLLHDVLARVDDEHRHDEDEQQMLLQNRLQPPLEIGRKADLNSGQYLDQDFNETINARHFSFNEKMQKKGD